MKIAIHRNEKLFKHSTSWCYVWEEYCRAKHLDYRIVNCFDSGIINELSHFDILLWHFSNYSLQDMLFARSILQSARTMGLEIFPDADTSWHFDDKIAEAYLLQSIKAPIPRSWLFFSLEECEDWLGRAVAYPLVAKLRRGSGSENVCLIEDRKMASSYVRRMFGRGRKTNPRIVFKAATQIRSSSNLETVFKRMKRIPDFIQKMNNAREFPREKGYVYFQEFVPNDGFDIKIVVVGHKQSFIVRNARGGDFRASGSGDLFYDRTKVTRDIIESAFDTSDRLRFQCMGYDYVIDKRDGLGKIIEMSYGFSHTALLQAGGYWDRAQEWHLGGLNAPVEVLETLMAKART